MKTVLSWGLILGAVCHVMWITGCAMTPEPKPKPQPDYTVTATKLVDEAVLSIHRLDTTCNTYFVRCKTTGDFVVIDPGAGIRKIVENRVNKGWTLKAYWITHGHGDHLSGFGELTSNITVPVVAHIQAKEAIEHSIKNWADWGMTEIAPHPPVLPDTWIDQGDTLSVGNLKIETIHAPGHSQGSVCYLLEGKYLFCGDVLFKDSVGRSDLPGSDYEILCKSLSHQLWDLPDETVVFPGHMESTVLSEEKRSNWFFQDHVRHARGLPPIPRPWLGIRMDQDLSVEPPGVIVLEVVLDSPSAKAGLKPGDVICAMAGMKINTHDDIGRSIKVSDVGQTVDLEIQRGGEVMVLKLTYGSRPVPK